MAVLEGSNKIGLTLHGSIVFEKEVVRQSNVRLNYSLKQGNRALQYLPVNSIHTLNKDK